MCFFKYYSHERNLELPHFYKKIYWEIHNISKSQRQTNLTKAKQISLKILKICNGDFDTKRKMKPPKLKVKIANLILQNCMRQLNFNTNKRSSILEVQNKQSKTA